MYDPNPGSVMFCQCLQFIIKISVGFIVTPTLVQNFVHCLPHCNVGYFVRVVICSMYKIIRQPDGATFSVYVVEPRQASERCVKCEGNVSLTAV
jgi:hypothetical protein